jgi:hypothetical protein
LPDEIRSRIAFENDEHAYSVRRKFWKFAAARVPMVFDAHHHVCREKLDDYNHPKASKKCSGRRAKPGKIPKISLFIFPTGANVSRPRAQRFDFHDARSFPLRAVDRSRSETQGNRDWVRRRNFLLSNPSLSVRSTNASTPVRFNGKAYRGRIEVFVNSRGTLTVVNAVSLEDYLLGVVPNELSLPAHRSAKSAGDCRPNLRRRQYQSIRNAGFWFAADRSLAGLSRLFVGIENGNASRYGNARRGRQLQRQTDQRALHFDLRRQNGKFRKHFRFNEPYLRGVECSLEGRKHFEPFLIKTVRQPAKLRDEKNLELVRLMSLLAVNGFQLSSPQITDDWFEDDADAKRIVELAESISVKFGKTFPNVNKDSANPLELARILAQMIYGDNYADTLLSEADINYQLAFDDAAEIPKERRADVAILFRDGF